MTAPTNPLVSTTWTSRRTKRLRWRLVPLAAALTLLPSVATASQTPVNHRSAAALSPTDVQALHAALDAYDAGDTSSAEPTLRRLVTAYPGSYQATEALGSLLVETGRVVEALPLLQRAAVLAPRDPLAHANLGAALSGLGQQKAAIPELRRAADLTTTPAAAHSLAERNLANALLIDDQPREAARAFAQAATGANSPELDYNWALALLRSGELTESAEVLGRIAEADRTDEIYALAADVEERLGHAQQALAQLQAATRKNPSDSNLYALTMELLRHWTWAPAIEVARFGETRFPASAHFRVAEGIARYASADYKGAVPVFAGLLAEQPENAGVADLLGRSCSLLAEGEELGCHGVYVYAMAHPSNAVMSTYAAASILHQPKAEQNLPQAQTLLAAAIRTDPRYAPAWFQMGVLHGTELEWKQSAADLEHAVALDPALPEAHYRLSRAYAHLGERDLAATQLQLQQKYASAAKSTLDARLESVVTFLLAPGGNGAGEAAASTATPATSAAPGSAR